MAIAERVNVSSNFRVVHGRLGTTPKAIRLDHDVFPITGNWNAEDVRKSLDVLCAFIDSTVPQIGEEEGEVTWEDVAWQ